MPKFLEANASDLTYYQNFNTDSIMIAKKEREKNEEFHVGKRIKAVLEEEGRTITWLAGKVCCTRENLYKVFRRSWISTDLLFKVSIALNHDFFKDCSTYLTLIKKGKD